MNESASNPEKPIQGFEVRDAMDQLHEEFYGKVHEYSPGRWQPKDALSSGAGSCMAELLYVAAGLVNQGIVSPNDLTIGFNKDRHGTMQTGNFGKTSLFYAHTFMLITSGDGRTYQAGFRENRADERPQFEALSPDDDDINDERLFIGSIDEAILAYGKALGQTVPEVELFSDIQLRQQGIDPHNQSSNITFDEDF